MSRLCCAGSRSCNPYCGIAACRSRTDKCIFRNWQWTFESHAGRPLPPTPQTRFVGGDMSLQEKGKVMRLAASLPGRAAGRGCILLAGFTNTCRFFGPAASGHHGRGEGQTHLHNTGGSLAPLEALAAVQRNPMGPPATSKRSTASAQTKKGARGTTDNGRGATATEGEVPKQRISEAISWAYASKFYAGPVMPPGARTSPQYRITDEEDAAAEAARACGAALFTPPSRCTAARRPERQPRLLRL